MAGRKPHRRGSYQQQAKAVTRAAAADPTTLCWRCGKMLHQHPPHKNGRPAFWTAGHLFDGVPDSPLLPEASVCNFHAGQETRHRQELRTTRTW